jgi:hypothetical protein
MVVRVGRIELPSYRWQRYILPLNYTRIYFQKPLTDKAEYSVCRRNLQKYLILSRIIGKRRV